MEEIATLCQKASGFANFSYRNVKKNIGRILTIYLSVKFKNLGRKFCCLHTEGFGFDENETGELHEKHLVG